MAREPISDADLDWLAFRYAAGELLGADLDTFEELLATDERACSAVARAVVLSQAVIHCELSAERVIQRTDLVSTPRSAGRNAMAACIVAMSLLFVCWMIQQTPRSGLPNDASSTVAALWIDGAADDSPDEPTLPNRDPEETVEDEPVPGWLLAAVHEQQQAVEDDEIIMNQM